MLELTFSNSTTARALIASLLCIACIGCGDDDGYWRADTGGGGYDTSVILPGDAGYYGDTSSGGEIPPPLYPEDYDDVGTNAYTHASHDPFSTFGADVDTASYDIFIQEIEAGVLPAPRSVRVEEYVNSFRYDYAMPEPGAEVPFDIHMALAEHPMGREHAQLRVAIQAEEPMGAEKLPSNIVFLVDTSGSMSSSGKLNLVQRVMRGTLDALDDSDTLSIVTYAGSTRVALTPTVATDREAILEVIDSFSAGGSTAGAAGIQLAYAQAEAGFIEHGFNHVVLCTDGDFNVGVSSDDALVELIEEKRETGVTLTALGFGRGGNDSMMERISNAGNGTYSVIANARVADDYASVRMFQSINLIAQDMKLQVEFNPDHVLAYRLLGYENRAIADHDFREDTVDAGEVGARHNVTALYEIVRPDGEVPEREGAPEVLDGEPVAGEREIDPGALVMVRVRWKHLGASADDPASEHAETLTPDDLQTATSDADLLWASAITAFAEILKENAYGDVAELDRIEEIVTAQASRDEDRAIFVEHFATARALIESR